MMEIGEVKEELFKTTNILTALKRREIGTVLLSKRIGKEYMNGLNKHSKLLEVFVIDSDQIIGIFFNENGQRKFKAHLTENISTREQLHLQGYKVIYNDFDRIEYKIFSLDIHNDIKRLVFQNFTANGKPVDNNYYESEWDAIKPTPVELSTMKDR